MEPTSQAGGAWCWAAHIVGCCQGSLSPPLLTSVSLDGFLRPFTPIPCNLASAQTGFGPFPGFMNTPFSLAPKSWLDPEAWQLGNLMGSSCSKTATGYH